MRDRFADISIQEKQQHFDKLNEYNAKLRQRPVLKSLFIEMTLNCNERCLHCGSNCGDSIPQNTLTDYEILQCLIELKEDMTQDKLPLPFLCITGGEPMLRPTLIPLMKTIHALGYKWGMTSNGTLIDAQTAQELKAAGMYSIGLSLDGLRDTHEWFRNSVGSFDKTLEAFHNLTAAGIESVMITTVVHQRNLSELEELRKLMKELNCRQWRVINIEPIGRALDRDDLLLDSDGYKKMMDFIVANQDDPDMRVIYSCNHYVGLDYERKVRPWYFTCRAGTSIASIQQDGSISACLDIERRPELSFGNIRQDNLYDIWKERFEIYRETKYQKSQKCSACEHAANCNGGGFHTWDFDSNQPRICMLEALGFKSPSTEA